MHIATLTISDRYSGPLVLKEGLRPFFLAANAWAVVSMLMWIGMLTGRVLAPAVMAAVEWHQHELLFGYTSAVIGGFMLTVAANWMGRAPVSGAALLASAYNTCKK